MAERPPLPATGSAPAPVSALPSCWHIRLQPVAGLLRWAIVASFLLTGVWKLLDISQFRQQLWAMGFFPDVLIPVLAPLLPVVEIALALCLALRWLEFPAIVVTAFLGLAFSGLHGYILANGIIVPCGCAGVREVLSGTWAHAGMASLSVMLFLSASLLAICPPAERRFAPH